jgi:hypothetical protein
VAAPLHQRVSALEMGTIILLDICAVHESAYGTKRTSQHAEPMSAFGGKADITRTCADVCFDPRLTLGGGWESHWVIIHAVR